MSTNIFGQVDDYIADLFVDEDDVFEQVLANIDEADIPRWNISPNQGKLLQVYAKLCNARRILELGTQGGFSTIWLAKALPDDGTLVTLELDENCVNVAKRNMALAGVENIVEVKQGIALDSLNAMIAEGVQPFDLVFIDADKPPYAEYLDCVLKLSRKGTFIIADNVIREGKVLQEHSDDPAVKGVQRFNKALAANKNVHATIVQSLGTKEHDGMALAVVC